MGESFWKMITTVVVWVIMGTIGITSLLVWSTNNMSEEWILMPLVIVPLALAFVSTLTIWTQRKEEPPTQQTYEKAKRTEGDKYALLMQMMDDDEREAFKDSLKRRLLDEAYMDGELSSTSLEELLAEKKLRH